MILTSIDIQMTFSTFSPTLQWNHEFNNHLSSLIRTTYTEKPGGFSAYTTDPNQVSFSEEERLFL